MNIADFTVILLDDPRHPDVFQLTDSTRGKLCQFGDVRSFPFGDNGFACFGFQLFQTNLVKWP